MGKSARKKGLKGKALGSSPKPLEERRKSAFPRSGVKSTELQRSPKETKACFVWLVNLTFVTPEGD